MQANYQVVGVHWAKLPCLSCGGEGTVRGYTCALCRGGGTYTVGCSQEKSAANVEQDLNHPTMCNCLTCGRFIDPREVTVRK